MGYRRILAAAAAFAMMGTAFSCGKGKTETSEVTDSSIVSEDTTDESGKSGTSDTKEKADKKTTTKAKEKSDKDTTTTKADKTSSAATTTKKADSSGGSSSGSNSTGGSSSGGGSSEGQAGEEVKEYTAEVTLGSSTTVKGSNVTVNGSVITVTGAGDFIFTGTLSNGQIVVKTGAAATDDKVTVVLNGVDITNPDGPAILIDEAKRCTVKPKDGSVNYLTSDVSKKDTTNGAIFSNDTLRLKGNGELNITANNAHGITSDDDVIIESGTYNITSRKSGIIANDDITINDGTVNIKAGTNGIKSKGTLNINGGYTEISGGTKEEKSSIYAAGSFNYTNGYLYAAGNKVTPPTNSDYPFVVADLVDTYEGGSTAEIFLNGGLVVSMQPHNNFRCLLMLSPDIVNGSSFYTVVNGERSADFTVGRGMNEFKMK